MPSVIGSPARQYTPPSSNDESLLPSNHFTSNPRLKQPTSSFTIATQHDTSLSATPASPPSSSEDSPTTSGGDTANYLNDDTEMLDYDDYTLTANDNESSPEALFFGRPQINISRQFTSANASPEGFSPFNAGLTGLRPNQSSPEFDQEGESPGLGSDMRGLRLNSRFPSPVQGTVRLEDVMLPNDDGLSNLMHSHLAGSHFEPKPMVHHVENGPPYELALVGIPPNGAKSRVETQIKLDLQLLHPGTDDLVKDAYDYIKLPAYGVSKEKFRLNNLKDGPKDIDLDKVLHLEASVVCTTQPTKSVFICEGCILRERKRALRKKDYKRKTNKRPPPSSPPLPADENQKIIVFNCPEIMDFTSGTCSLPTRITCYCRHHKEKQGFKIVLVVKDSAGNVVGRCVSGNIMITDDHKAQGKGEDAATGRGGESKRRSSEEGRVSGVTSRRSSMDSVEEGSGARKRKIMLQQDMQSNTAVTNTAAAMQQQGQQMGNAMQAKQVKIPRNLSMTKLNKMEPMSSTGGKQRPSPYPTTSPSTTFMRTQSMDSVPKFFAGTNHVTAATPSNAGRWQTPRQTSATAPNSRSNSPPDMLFSSANLNINTQFDHSFPEFQSQPQTPFSGIQSAPTSSAASPEDTTQFSSFQPQQRWTLDSMPGITIPSEIESPQPLSLFPATAATANVQTAIVPTITKMVPTEGPTTGGIEVTILGQGFTSGITAQFGEVTAIPTECYSPSTLVCLLPPSPTPGPVFVTLKDAFGRPLGESLRIEQKQLFTYVNTTDRALMELALQIMGFKWLGKLEDARNVAAMIIGSNHSSPAQGEMAALGGAGLENTLLRCLDVIDGDTSPHPAKLSQKNRTGHTLLHLAAIAGMRRLVAGLLVRGVNPAVRDRAGFTALHYAAWLGRGKVVQRLLSGENTGLLSMKTLEGKTPMELAVEMGRMEIRELLDQSVFTGQLSRASSVASLVSLGESLSRASPDEYFAGSEWDESNYNPSAAVSEDEEAVDEELWLGSLRNSSSEPSTPGSPSSVDSSEIRRRRGFFHLTRPQLPQFPQRLQLPQLPDPHNLNPALYVTALNELLQPYLQALRLTNQNPDTKLPSPTLTGVDDGPSSDEKKYDLPPPPAYSELYPLPVQKEKFSLATRLSLRGRSFLRWTGMAGDAGLSPEEIEFLRREENRRKAWTRDYMLIFFWIPVLVCILGFTLLKGVNVVRGMGAMTGGGPMEVHAARIVEVRE